MSSDSPTPFFDVRMRGFATRTDVDDAVDLIRSRSRILGLETVELDSASGRVLATDVTAAIAVPHFDRAAYDGYAVRAIDTSASMQKLRVIGEALPGRPFAGAVGSGQAVRIMTGSPMPAGADAVLPAESSEETGGMLRVVEPVAQWKNIGRIGEDVPVGRTVLEAGRVLRPQDLGLLSSIGIGKVEVIRRPRVAIVVTGDEILPPGSTPVGYQIVDSNSIMLRALVRRDGGEALPTRHLPDRVVLIRAAMMADDWDVLLVSGGTSVGSEDHAPRLLAELGELAVHGVALKPAGPTGIGFIGGRPVILLPGNPVACLVAYDLFAGRAIRLLGSRNGDLPYRTIVHPAAVRIQSTVGRVDYLRVRINSVGVEPIQATGASILSTAVIADGFVLVPKPSAGFAVGEPVPVYLFDS